MGITGFAFENNSVNFVNRLDRIRLHKSQDKPISLCFSINNKVLNRTAFKILSRRLTEHSLFQDKIDNFLNIDKLQNVIFSAVQDEFKLGCPAPVGAIQLYNKKNGNIKSEELLAVHHIRKIVGAALVKSDLLRMLLKILIGIKNNDPLNGDLIASTS